MKDLIKIQQKLIPDLIDKMYRRFSILTTISNNQPVGRRSLSEHMDITERVLRSETDMLKKQDLIQVKSTGMEITEEGKSVLNQLNEYFNIYTDDNQLADQIKSTFGIKEVHVIPGDADAQENVKSEMGRQAGQLLESILYEDAIVSVTGGSTMANVSRAIIFYHSMYFSYQLVVALVRMLFIKLTRFQRAWRNKQVVIIQHFMYQIM